MQQDMKGEGHASRAAMLRKRLLSKAALVPLGIVLALAVATAATAQPAAAQVPADAEDEVVLPTRVANAISRTETALANAVEHIDQAEYAQAVVSLTAVRNNMCRADRAATAQMNAVPAVPADPEDEPAEPADPADPAEPEEPEEPTVPVAPTVPVTPTAPADPNAAAVCAPAAPVDPEAEPVDPEAEPADPADPDTEAEESTAGPDSVVAVLTLDQKVVTTLAGLFDTTDQGSITALTDVLVETMNARDRLLTAVTGLAPEGAGADYTDVMADTVAGYTDEVANLTEALQDDTLSAGAKQVLQDALTKSQATLTQMNTAFGGGE